MKKHIYYYRDKTKLCTKKFFKLKYLGIFKNSFKINNTIRQSVMIKSFKINKNFNLSKLKKYCIFSGRLRFVIKNQKVSRMFFRELVSQGLIAGVFKR